MKYDFEISGDIGFGFGSMEYTAQMLKKFEGKPVAVRVESLGGYAHHGFGIAQRFADHGDVTAYMVGMCASAATILAMGAKKICMERNAGFLVHKCNNVVWELGVMNADEIRDTIKELKKQAEQQDSIDRIMMSMYANKTGKDVKALEKLMQEERFLSAEEALEWGLIDEIFDSKEAAKQTMKQRASWEGIAAAYSLPLALPKQSVKQQITNTIINTEESMKNFFDSILAFFGIEAMADANEEQMNGALDQIKAKHEETKNALDTANATIAERDATIAEQVQTITDKDAQLTQAKTDMESALAKAKEEHDAAMAKAKEDADKALADAKAEMQKTIDEQAEQIKALQAAPGADTNEPVGGEGGPKAHLDPSNEADAQALAQAFVASRNM